MGLEVVPSMPRWPGPSARLGIEAITGKPNKPTTQGKNERFHQTLFRYLDKQPLAATAACERLTPGGEVDPSCRRTVEGAESTSRSATQGVSVFG